MNTQTKHHLFNAQILGRFQPNQPVNEVQHLIRTRNDHHHAEIIQSHQPLFHGAAAEPIFLHVYHLPNTRWVNVHTGQPITLTGFTYDKDGYPVETHDISRHEELHLHTIPIVVWLSKTQQPLITHHMQVDNPTVEAHWALHHLAFCVQRDPPQSPRYLAALKACQRWVQLKWLHQSHIDDTLARLNNKPPTTP